MDAQTSALSVTQTFLAFMTLLPKPATILACDRTDSTGQSVRVNEYTAIAVSLAVALMLSIIAKDKGPLLASLGTCAILTAGVEYLTRKESETLNHGSIPDTYLG